MTRAAADGHDVWAKARQDSDFATFLAALERNVELKRRYIECFAPYDDPQVAIVGFSPRGGGGSDAAPAASQILDYYFHGPQLAQKPKDGD